jgi:hypothetical protein
MKRIQLLGTKPYGFGLFIISWIIRVLEWSKQSNVVLYFPDEQNVRYVYLNKIKEENIDSFMERNRLIRIQTIEITEDQYQNIQKYSKAKLGSQSGYFLSLFGSVIPLFIKNIFKLKTKNFLYKGMTPGEFARECARQIDEVFVFVLTNDIHKGTFSTDDALELYSKLSNKK